MAFAIHVCVDAHKLIKIHPPPPSPPPPHPPPDRSGEGDEAVSQVDGEE